MGPCPRGVDSLGPAKVQGVGTGPWGWKETGGPTVQEVVLPDPPEIKDLTTAETAAKRRRATRKAK